MCINIIRPICHTYHRVCDISKIILVMLCSRILFQNISSTEHRAVVTFSEGDYTFDIRGTDLGGHSAEVNLDYEKVQRFYVDETSPLVEEIF